MRKISIEQKRKKCGTVMKAALAMLLLSVSLSGCRREEPVSGSSVTAETEQSEEAAETKEEESEPAAREAAGWEEATLTAEGSAERMIASGGYLFFKYGNTIRRIEEETGEIKLLRTFEEGEENAAFWVYKGGLYFDSGRAEPAGPPGLVGLYRLDLETGEEEHLADLMMRPTSIYASEDILYIRSYGMNLAYALDQDGRTKGELVPAETVYGRIPEGCRELFTGMLPYEVERCGYMPVQNEQCLVIAEADGSNPREVKEITNTSSVLFAEDCFFAWFNDGSGRTRCWRYEADTLERTLVFESMNNPQPVQYRDGLLYYMENPNADIVSSETVFYQVSADQAVTGTQAAEQILTVKKEPGMTSNYTYYGNFFVTDQGVYCQQFKNYGIYIGKIKPGRKNAELLEPVLYQSLLRQLGHAEGESETISSASGEYPVGRLYTEKMIFEGKSEAAEAMSRVMEEKRQQLLESARQAIASMNEEEWIHPVYTLTFVINGTDGITYLDDRYCSILAEGYEYAGGAHGMPFREYFVFDRETGAQLTLEDLVANPVGELQKTVGAAFRKLAEETDFAYEAPEALEFTVSDNVSFETPFFLTEEGIGFFYHPYEIAPYAAGFPEVVIPYEEFELKINLSQK